MNIKFVFNKINQKEFYDNYYQKIYVFGCKVFLVDIPIKTFVRVLDFHHHRKLIKGCIFFITCIYWTK